MQRTSSDFSAVAAASERAALLCTSSLMASPVQPWLGSVLYHTAARVPLPPSFLVLFLLSLSLLLSLYLYVSAHLYLSLCILHLAPARLLSPFFSLPFWLRLTLSLPDHYLFFFFFSSPLTHGTSHTTNGVRILSISRHPLRVPYFRRRMFVPPQNLLPSSKPTEFTHLNLLRYYGMTRDILSQIATFSQF